MTMAFLPLGRRAFYLLAATFFVLPALSAPAQAQSDAVRVSKLLDWHFERAGEGDVATPSFTTQFPRPDVVPGVRGAAWRSDGFSSWVSAPLQLSPHAGFTASTWIALESYPSGYEMPLVDQIPGSIMQQASKDAGFDVYIDAYGHWGLRLSTMSGPLKAQAKVTFPLNTWVHVAASYDPTSGVARLFLNGALVAAGTGRPADFKPGTGDFQIAHSWRSAPLGEFNINGLDAAYDDVMVMGGALSAAQIKAEVSAVRVPPAGPSLVVPASRFATDLQRPSYHAMPAANWTNEPHGLIRRGNNWHMFYQRTPNGPFKTLMTWGHMVSDDLVHWADLPIALRPELQTQDFGFDMKGIWSGDVVTGPHGWAYAFYTSVNHSPKLFNPGISLAISDDPGLLHWQKVGPLVDSSGLRDFRDPYVWFEGGEARMIVGAALDGGGGIAFYRCADLAARGCWKRQPDIAPFGQMDPDSQIWEMPVFAAIAGGKYILEANPIGGKISKYGDRATRSVYWIGRWDGVRFRPDAMKPKMLDVLPGHLSPTVDRDVAGALVGIGIVDERRTARAQLHAGWAHTFSLPRVWRLMPDGETLGQSPLPALEQLRHKEEAIDTHIGGSGDMEVGDLGRAVEIKVRFDMIPQAGSYGLTLAATPDGREVTRLSYDPQRHEIVLDKQHSTLAGDGEGPTLLRGAYDEAAFGKPVEFHVFVDHSVVDVFVNDAAAMSFRLYPTRADASRFGIAMEGKGAAQVQAWRLASAPIQ